MRAVGYYKSLPISDPESLQDLDIAKPAPGPHELLVSVKAIAVNPVDTKVRKRSAGQDGQPKILGWDAAGVVEAVGPEVTLFKPGDEVYYAGAIQNPGCNSENHCVDERIVGRKPKTLSFTQSAALPLTSLTAWELLFDRLGVSPGKQSHNKSLLIIGGAGGVGSILIQFARKLRLTGLTIIATASRPESRQWCLDLGAHRVIDHSKPLSQELDAIDIPEVDYIASLTNTDQHWDQIVECLAPQGRVGLIDDPPTLDALKLKQKAASLHWEFMFARALYETDDMIAQHRILDDIRDLVDAGVIKTTMGQDLGPINAANLRQAHAAIESGRTVGKIVLTGW